MAGWHHRLSGRESEQTLGDSEGQGSLACCSRGPHNPLWTLAPLGVGRLALGVGDPAPEETPPSGWLPTAQGGSRGQAVRRGMIFWTGQREHPEAQEDPAPKRRRGVVVAGGGGDTLSCI